MQYPLKHFLQDSTFEQLVAEPRTDGGPEAKTLSGVQEVQPSEDPRF